MASIETITNDENLLILVATPGDETHLCGGLIAASCRRGRPPYVMVLADGSATSNAIPAHELANRHDRETRHAVQHLGLPLGRLLMAGLYDGQIPTAGPAFEAVIRAVTLVMWARDCNRICAPAPDGTRANQATHRIAQTVATTSGVTLLTIAPEGDLVLDITPQLPRKQAAQTAHASRPDLPAPTTKEAYYAPSPTGRGQG